MARAARGAGRPRRARRPACVTAERGSNAATSSRGSSREDARSPPRQNLKKLQSKSEKSCRFQLYRARMHGYTPSNSLMLLGALLNLTYRATTKGGHGMYATRLMRSNRLKAIGTVAVIALAFLGCSDDDEIPSVPADQ